MSHAVLAMFPTRLPILTRNSDPNKATTKDGRDRFQVKQHQSVCAGSDLVLCKHAAGKHATETQPDRHRNIFQYRSERRLMAAIASNYTRPNQPRSAPLTDNFT